MKWQLFGKSLLAAIVAICVNTLACLMIAKAWQVTVVGLGLTHGLYNDIDYIGLSIITTVIAFTGVLFVGLPLQAITQRMSLTAWHWYSFPSAVSTVVLGYILTTSTHYQRRPVLVWVISFCLGFLFGGVFWLIRRPDKDVRLDAGKA